MFDCINPDSKLEMIADRNECEFTRQVFKSGSCSRLRSLNMSIYGFKELRTELFPFMNNMPYLESLYLDNCHLGIEDCETLHNNLPSLRSLNLYNIHLKIDQLPANIKPATFVTELNFSFECLGDKENHLRWYQYVSRKYTNLNDFSYDDMEVNNSSSEYSRKIHQDGLLPLYKTMGRRLKDLKLNNAPVDIGIFTQLDGSDCRIRFIDLQYNGDALFPQLAQSKQSKYVKKLSLEETYIASPSLLQNMTSLSSLTMVVEEKINLAEFMNAFPPTLTQFDVVCDDVEISHFPKYPNNIRELHIKSDDLPKTVGQLISTYCPKLKHLELRGRIFENIHIDCQNTHFKRLYIEARRLDNDRKHGFLLKYANASQSLCYVERPVPGKPDSPRVQLGSASELEGTTLIEITCASTNDMTLLTYIGDGMF
jgi:hypothetical protein